uniref:Uncharacterized protein n=1 Tax=Ananas comosus var. bracteatus TaxID=296719 RepID=A0A6V7QK84_ANACO|nr:unnamed protein product [Ananas comosus var. bracteatus]
MATTTTTTSIHVTALDGVVNVNSLFTVAVFVGLSLTGPPSPGQGGGCSAGADVARNLLAFEVVSFSFFLFSSLVAQGLKLALNLINANDPHDAFRARIDARLLRLGMLASAGGSVLGCVFLLLSMVDVIQIRLGLLSCGAPPPSAPPPPSSPSSPSPSPSTSPPSSTPSPTSPLPPHHPPPHHARMDSSLRVCLFTIYYLLFTIIIIMLVMGTTDASLLIIIHCSNVFYLFLLLAKLYKVSVCPQFLVL